MTYTFAPNNFNYADCNRCFYLKYKLNIEIKGNFPRIFNAFDFGGSESAGALGRSHGGFFAAPIQPSRQESPSFGHQRPKRASKILFVFLQISPGQVKGGGPARYRPRRGARASAAGPQARGASLAPQAPASSAPQRGSHTHAQSDADAILAGRNQGVKS